MQVMGEMDGFFKLGNNFMYLFPCFVALFCLCTMFNVWGRTARSSFMKNLFKKYDQLFLYSPSSLLTFPLHYELVFTPFLVVGQSRS